jgi:3-oxoacyl-[acyl-carrier-protein] synthase II
MTAPFATASRARRVAVTGVGALTPLGASLAETRAALSRGEIGARSAVPESPGLFAAPARDFDARAHFRLPKALKLADRKCRLAVAAAAQAVADAGLAADDGRENWAVVFGCSASNLQVEEIARALAAGGAGSGAGGKSEDNDVSRFASRVLGGLNPLWLLVNLPNMVGAHVGIQLAMNGPNQTVTGDRTAGAQAIGEAWLAIAGGECDVAVAGGADAPLDPFDLGCFASERRGDSPTQVLAEGAAAVVLEERERALARGARIYAEVAGFATAPSPAVAERRALAAAGWSDEEEFRAEIDPGWSDAIGDTQAAAGALDAVLLLAAPRQVPARLRLRVDGAAGQSAVLLLDGFAMSAATAA